MNSLKQYFKFHFSFRGRLNRKAYILIILKELLLIFLFAFALGVGIPALEHIEINKSIITLVIIILASAFFPVIISVSVSQLTCIVKRLHDLNLSGYWLLLVGSLSFVGNVILELIELSVISLPFVIEMVVALLSLIIGLGSIIYLLFIRGTKGDNKYGPDPLQTGNLNTPQLSKSMLLLITVPAIVVLFVSLSMVFIKKGFKEGLETAQKEVEEGKIEIKKRRAEKKRQAEQLKKLLEGNKIEENEK